MFRPIVFNDFASPICLPFPREHVQEELTVSGWGRSYSSFFSSFPTRSFQRERSSDPRDADEEEREVQISPQRLPPRSGPRLSPFPYSQIEDFICATSFDTRDFFAPRTCHV